MSHSPQVLPRPGVERLDSRRALRCVIGMDGSDGAHTAAALASELAWPEGSVLIFVTAIAHHPRLPGGETLPVRPLVANALDARVAEAALRAGRPVPRRRHLLGEGPPGRVIIEHARRLRADLIIMGSRGLGGIAAAALGSVAAEVMDRATCPVLVARSPRVERMIVATDGSECSREALHWVALTGLLPGRPATIVGVAEEAPLLNGTAPARAAEVAVWERTMDQTLQDASTNAWEAHAELARVGIDATVEIKRGDAAEQILAVAKRPDELIVIGCRGRTGLARLVLGSVSRRVLTGAVGSVLVIKAGACCGLRTDG